MKNIVAALLLSLGFHFALGAVLAVCLSPCAAPEVSVRLDLSRVELSFAPEEEAASEPASSFSASPEVSPRAPAPSPPPAEDVAAADIAPTAQPPDAPPAEVRDPVEPPPLVETPSTPSATESKARPAPRQAKVDAPPRLRKNLSPKYPRGARERGEAGAVTIEMSVDADGRVADVSIVTGSGYPELDAAAVEAAKRARFVPAESGGRAVASRVRLTLDFKLHDR